MLRLRRGDPNVPTLAAFIYLYDCTNKMDLSTKKPPRRPSHFVASPVPQSRNATGRVDGRFRLSFAELVHPGLRAGPNSVTCYLPRISLFYLVEGYSLGASLTRRPTRPNPRAPTMPKPFRSLLPLLALAAGLSGCGTVNEKLSAGMGDYVPQWAGGLPADAPPRAGTPQYDAYMKERERKRLMPAADREKEEQAQKGATGVTSGNAVR